MDSSMIYVIKKMFLIGIVDIICILIVCINIEKNESINSNYPGESSEIIEQEEFFNNSTEDIDEYLTDVENVEHKDIDLQKSMLRGIYTTEDSKLFCFMDNDSFAGYFDENNKNVSDYRYQLENINELLQVSIFNPETGSKIKYFVYFQNDGSVELQYGDSQIRFRLEK